MISLYDKKIFDYLEYKFYINLSSFGNKLSFIFPFKQIEEKKTYILWHWWWMLSSNFRVKNKYAKNFDKLRAKKKEVNIQTEIPEHLRPYLLRCGHYLYYKVPRRKIPKKIRIDLDEFVIEWLNKLKEYPIIL